MELQNLDSLLRLCSFQHPEHVRERIRDILQVQERTVDRVWSVRQLPSISTENVWLWLYSFWKVIIGYWKVLVERMVGFVHVLSGNLVINHDGVEIAVTMDVLFPLSYPDVDVACENVQVQIISDPYLISSLTERYVMHVETIVKSEVRSALAHPTAKILFDTIRSRVTAANILGQVFDRAVAKGDTNTVRRIVETEHGRKLVNGARKALHVAASRGYTAIVSELLTAGADLNAVRSTMLGPCTALDLACNRGHIDVVQLLLRQDNVTGLNEALCITSSTTHTDIVKTLLIAGANVNAVSKRESALQQALRADRLDVFRLLVKHASPAILHDSLCNAATTGYTSAVKLLLDAGAEVNIEGQFSQSALLFAFDRGHTSVVQLLIQRADITTLNTTLYTAAEMGNVGAMEMLLAAGADINAESRRCFKTSLSVACAHGHIDTVQFILRQHNVRGLNKALCHAAGNGRTEIVAILLSAGADANAATDGFLARKTPFECACHRSHLDVVHMLISLVTNEVLNKGLYVAVLQGHTSIVSALLAAGANVNALADGHRGDNTPLAAACSTRRLEMVQALLSSSHNAIVLNTALGIATCVGCEQIVEVLLAAGADANARPYGRSSAVMMACTRGHFSIVRLLLPHASEMTLNDAFASAAGSGWVDIVELFLEAGINASYLPDDQALEDYESALALACSRGHNEVVQLLLPHTVMSIINAALRAAARGGHLYIVEQLLAAGADINAVDMNTIFGTAMREACSSGHADIVRLLLIRNASVNAGCSYSSAIHLASTHDHVEVIQVLLDYDKRLLERTLSYSRNTPLCDAIEGNATRAVQCLLAAGANVQTAAVEQAMFCASSKVKLDPVLVQALLLAGTRNRCVLLCCVRTGHPKLIEQALELGIMIRSDTSAVYEAVRLRDCAALELLLDYGADVMTMARYRAGIKREDAESCYSSMTEQMRAVIQSAGGSDWLRMHLSEV